MPRRRPLDFLVSKSVRLPNSLVTRIDAQIQGGRFESEAEFIRHCLETVLTRIEDNQKESGIEPFLD